MSRLASFIGLHKLGLSGIMILLLTAVIVGGGIVGSFQIKKLQKDVAFFQNEAARRDEIHQIDSTTVSRLSLKVRDITSSNRNLQNRINLLDGTIRSQADLIVSLEESATDVPTDSDIIIVDGEEQVIRTFDMAKGAFTLKGWFQLQDPYNITFEQLAAQMDLELNMVQLPSGQWEAFIDTKNPSLLVTDLVTKVNPYKPPWWKKFILSGGVYLQGNEFGLIGGVGYDKFLGLIGYDPRGYMLGVQYVF